MWTWTWICPLPLPPFPPPVDRQVASQAEQLVELRAALEAERRARAERESTVAARDASLAAAAA